MDIEQRVTRLEWYAAERNPGVMVDMAAEIRRDLVSRDAGNRPGSPDSSRDPFRAQVERDHEVDGLRAQLAEVTRERDALRRAVGEANEARDAAVKRACRGLARWASEEAKWSSYSIGESDGLKVAAREARRRGKGK